MVAHFHHNQFLKLDSNVFLNQDRQFTWPDINGKEYGKCGTCYGLRKQIAILVNGDVVPCCMDAEGELKLGNIFEEKLEEILDTDRAKNIVEGFKRKELVEPFCRTCGFIREVRGRRLEIVIMMIQRDGAFVIQRDGAFVSTKIRNK